MQPTLTFTGLDRRPVRLRPSAIVGLGADAERHAILRLADGRSIAVRESGQIVRLALRQARPGAAHAACDAVKQPRAD